MLLSAAFAGRFTLAQADTFPSEDFLGVTTAQVPLFP